jgi:hypothetical protein
VGELDEFVCQVDGQKSEALQLFACFEMVFILSTGNLYPPWHNSLTLVRSLWFLVFPECPSRFGRARLQLLGLVHQCIVGQVPTFGDTLLMHVLWLLNATKVLTPVATPAILDLGRTAQDRNGPACREKGLRS